MPDHHSTPPRFYSKLFRWFCKEDLYDELEGDMYEEYYFNLEATGAKSARAAYRKEVLKMIRPSVVKRIKTHKQHHNHTAMFKNYTLVAFRNLSRNKLFSTINIFGLAISMAVGLIAITFVSEINSYDTFHQNKDRIYRVNNTRINKDGSTGIYATTSLYAGERLRNDFAGFEKVVSVSNSFYGDLVKDNETHPIRGYVVSAEFLEVFTFPLRHGNPATALKEPFSVVLTVTTAERIFGKTDVVGEVLKRGNDQYQVTGVMEDVPGNSHLKFQAVASLSTYRNGERYASRIDNWTNMWSTYVYLLLPEEHDLSSVQANLTRLTDEENAKGHRFDVEMGLESLLSIFPGDGKYNQISTVMPKENVKSIVILTLIVIFSACFNYANLSIARSLKRAKEIGVRKVVGARKSQIFGQFIAEAIIVSLIALVISYFFFLLIRPEFIKLSLFIERTTSLSLTTINYLYFFGFAVITGFLAGLLPSLLMTKFKPVSILKGVSNMKMTKGLGLRKVLIGLQFTLSMGFAILVTLAYKQYRFAMNFDLGYATENVLNVPLQGNDAQLMKTALEQVAEVQGISTASMVPSTGSLNSDHARLLNGTDSIITYSMSVDEHYITNMDHQLVAGDNFNPALIKDQMIVNEEFTKKFGFSSATEALGSRVAFYSDTSTIVGVVKDFHYGTIYNDIQPFAFAPNSGRFYYLNLRLTSNDMISTMNDLSKAWATVDPDHDFQASFFKEGIERTYDGLSSTMKTYGMLAFIAISISILGLLGMAVYTTEARIKELTIRKVLGASLSHLVFLLSKNFMVIFIVAAGIAVPLSFSLFRTRIIRNMEYTMDVGFWELSSGALLVILIAALTIGSQTMKAAKTNPAKNLRNE